MSVTTASSSSLKKPCKRSAVIDNEWIIITLLLKCHSLVLVTDIWLELCMTFPYVHCCHDKLRLLTEVSVLHRNMLVYDTPSAEGSKLTNIHCLCFLSRLPCVIS